jgi:hypothetical protein
MPTAHPSFHPPEGYTLYMGKDKYENEDLIRFGLPEDVWFHVDSLSSAHVYLRQKKVCVCVCVCVCVVARGSAALCGPVEMIG